MLRFRTRRRARAVFIAVTLAAVPALPVRAADTEVNIENFTFAPKELTVKAGTVIVFRNRDDIPHTVNGSKCRVPFQGARYGRELLLRLCESRNL